MKREEETRGVRVKVRDEVVNVSTNVEAQTNKPDKKGAKSLAGSEESIYSIVSYS